MRYAESINQSLHNLMSDNRDVILIGEDILDPYGGAFKVAKGLSTRFSDQVISTPISEPSITGFATGMALRGLRPILEIMFGDFMTLCADQIINHAVKFQDMYNNQVEVPLIIRTPMGARRGYGPTHSQTLETIYLNIPNLTIASPSLFHDPGTNLEYFVKNTKSPVIFLENKMAYSQMIIDNEQAKKKYDLHVDNIGTEDLPIMHLSTNKEEANITIIGHGGMSEFCAKAAKDIYEKESLDVEVILPLVIKPFPIDVITPFIRKSNRVIVVEESHLYSGWGAEVACQITERCFDTLRSPVTRVGAANKSIPSSMELEKDVIPESSNIMQAIWDNVLH